MKVGVMEYFYKLLHPCMIVLVASMSKNEGSNVMTCAWNMPMSEDLLIIALSLGKEGYTGELIKKSGEFTVNIPDERLLKALWLCETRSGRRINKFKRANLTSIPS